MYLRLPVHFLASSDRQNRRKSGCCEEIAAVPPKRILVPSSRGDRTPLELFRSGVQGLPATIRAALCQAATG